MAGHLHLRDDCMLRRPWETCIVLIALLLTGALLLGGLMVGGLVEYARTDRAALDLGSIQGALKLYRARTGTLPEDSLGLEALVGRELEQIPRDPWGRPYLYRRSGDEAEVWTYGRDGQPGGEGQDRDLSTARMGDAERAAREHARLGIPPLLLFAAAIWGPALILLGGLRFARARKELKALAGEGEPLGLHVSDKP
jgi:general secretion pathway protein G